jgi:DNA-binding transcriptional MerR regulator
MTLYTIQEMIDQTGLPRRTIHFYTQQGILPPPDGAGLSSRYTDTHLLRLKLIPFLRQDGLRLDQIREYFTTCDEATLIARLEEKQSHRPTLSSPLTAPAAPPNRFVHYPLPQGLTLVVPAELAARQSARIQTIIRTIQEGLQA